MIGKLVMALLLGAATGVGFYGAQAIQKKWDKDGEVARSQLAQGDR